MVDSTRLTLARTTAASPAKPAQPVPSHAFARRLAEAWLAWSG